jgi:hypothetical protein
LTFGALGGAALYRFNRCDRIAQRGCFVCAELGDTAETRNVLDCRPKPSGVSANRPTRNATTLRKMHGAGALTLEAILCAPH